jgi:hypothetical protein
MTQFSKITRRQFLLTAGDSAAGFTLLKGCCVSPHSESGHL